MNRGIYFVLVIILCISLQPSGAQEPMESGFIKVLDGLKFPEGPAWDGRDKLYASNCYGDWISVIGPDTSRVFLRASEEPFTFAKTNGMTIGPDGCLYACDFGKGAILRITPAGKSEIFIPGYEGKPFNRPNDLAFDRKGNLYFTDPKSYDRNNRDGAVYRYDARKKTVTRVADDLAFPNGIAFSANGKFLHVCESAFERVLRFPVQKNGLLGPRSIYIELPGGDPDGIAFNQLGDLYVAHFGGGAIHVIDKNGKIKEILMTPGKKPSNVEFAGPDLRTLYITEDETNAIYKCTVKTPGLKLFGLKP